MIFRKLSRAEIQVFLSLVWTAFCEFEASNYSEQAKMIFKSAIYDQNYLAIFKRFYCSRFSTDTQGIGLGLPLAQAIIEAHGGSIRSGKANAKDV